MTIIKDEDDTLAFYYNGDKNITAYNIIEHSLQKEGHYLINYYNEFKIDVYLLLDNPKSKYIAIDWDNTISADQDYFIKLILELKKAGYTPFVCTLRAPDKENIKEIRGILEVANIAIYLTDGKPKRRFMRSLGIKVHLWIDDFYPGICRDSSELLTCNNIT